MNTKRLTLARILMGGPLFCLGCAAPISPAEQAERTKRGYIYYLDGAGGGTPLSNWSGGVRKGFRDAGYPGYGEMFSWETGLGVAADQVASVEYKRQKAGELAGRVEAFRRSHPSAPVTLIGLSAGTVIAVFALEALAPDTYVDDVIMLSGSLSADHDLTAALRHVHGRMYVFTSERDAVLHFLMPVTGTADRESTAHGSIGVIGARLPPGATADTRAQYRKVVTIPWHEEFARLGNQGQHTDTVKAPFVQAVVAPLVMKGGAAPVAATSTARLVSNPDYARWAAWAPGSWVLLRGHQVLDGVRSPLEIKATLVSKDAHRLVVDREFDAGGAATVSARLRRIMVPVRIDPSEHPTTTPRRRTSELPAREITIAGRSFTCHGHRLSASGSFPAWGENVEATYYTSDKIPGGLARLELKTTLDGKAAAFEGEIVEFHAAGADRIASASAH